MAVRRQLRTRRQLRVRQQRPGRSPFQVFQAIHDHFQQDLREFWQRSNFYLVVDGVLVSAFATSHVHALQLILSCAGLVISLSWLLVARGSIASLALWRVEVRHVHLIVNRFRSFSTIEGSLRRKPWPTYRPLIIRLMHLERAGPPR